MHAIRKIFVVAISNQFLGASDIGNYGGFENTKLGIKFVLG